MNHPSLAVYLNDHLAGSVTAIELLNGLQTTTSDLALAEFAAELQNEIAADQRELQKIVEMLAESESLFRQAAAWIADKAARLKLRLDDPGHGLFRAFEILEVLSLGIEGKRTLWRTLQHLATSVPALEPFDFARLIQRAEEQRDQVERRRLQVASRALLDARLPE